MALGSAALLLAVFVLIFGWYPIVDGFYRLGVFPRQPLSEIEATLGARYFGVRNFRCEWGTEGWDYICIAERHPVAGAKTVGGSGPVKFGVRAYPLFGPANVLELPVSQPTPRAEAELEKAARRAEWLMSTFSINDAGPEEIVFRLNIDAALARRIVDTARARRFATAEDLLLVDGVDAQLVERVRPLIRFTQF